MKNSDAGGRRLVRALLAAGLLAVFASQPTEAQDHDLVMFSVDADPKPLKRGCSASLFASFLINGHMDDQLSSGDAEIVFYWADGASPVPAGPGGWSLIGTLPVTWSPADGVFAPGREWPTGFPSVAGSTLSWTVPTSTTTFHLMAEVAYTAAGVTDDVPGNNQVVVPGLPSVEGDCGGGSCCVATSTGLMICNLACLGHDGFRVPRETLICLLRPEVCRPAPIPLCRLIDCNPCLLGLTCPPLPWEVMVRWPEEVLRLELYAGNEPLARSETLPRPIEHGGETYYQVIRFTPQKGVDYSLRSFPGAEAKVGEVYPLALEARQTERGKSGQ